MQIMKLSFLLLSFVLPFVLADLRVGFYKSTCQQAESIIYSKLCRTNSIYRDRSITAALLRMHFHDCFVRGCDASIPIDSTENNQSEKDAEPKETVRGYEIIVKAKKILEDACPSTVFFCADIITLATRDAVALAGGPKYTLATGRRDGLISDAVNVSLPGAAISVPRAMKIFADRGFTLNEMGTLLGAHTVGVAHCSFFENRLSDAPGGSDPPMDPTLAAKLRKTCAKNRNATAF